MCPNGGLYNYQRQEVCRNAARIERSRNVYHVPVMPYINENPTVMDMRFPGQWFQLETGLAYNWHRHYDATMGRHVQPDRLGLVAMLNDGPSVYAYAHNSPATRLDPTGNQAALGVCVAGGPANPLCDAPIAQTVVTAAVLVIGICERRTASSPGGAGSPLQRCLRAANGSPGDWENFCASIPSAEQNN